MSHSDGWLIGVGGIAAGILAAVILTRKPGPAPVSTPTSPPTTLASDTIPPVPPQPPGPGHTPPPRRLYCPGTDSTALHCVLVSRVENDVFFGFDAGVMARAERAALRERLGK